MCKTWNCDLYKKIILAVGYGTQVLHLEREKNINLKSNKDFEMIAPSVIARLGANWHWCRLYPTRSASWSARGCPRPWPRSWTSATTSPSSFYCPPSRRPSCRMNDSILTTFQNIQCWYFPLSGLRGCRWSEPLVSSIGWCLLTCDRWGERGHHRN